MLFDRYEIHIQAFGDVFYGKLSVFDPPLHKTILKLCTHFFTKRSKAIRQTGTQTFEHFRFFFMSTFAKMI